MNNLWSSVKLKSPTILITLGCVGIVGTGYSVFKATPKYLEYVKKNPDMGKGGRAKAALKFFWPSLFLGASSAACFIGAHTIDVHRQAALASALGISETALLEYKTAAEEVLSESDMEKVEEKIAEHREEKTPVPEATINERDFHPGEVLFYEPASGTYFWSTTEAVRRAELDCLEDCMSGMFTSIRDLFDRIDSPQLTPFLNDDKLGWNAEHPIRISWTVTEQTPGIVVYSINYRENPTTEYADLHGPVYY